MDIWSWIIPGIIVLIWAIIERIGEVQKQRELDDMKDEIEESKNRILGLENEVNKSEQRKKEEWLKKHDPEAYEHYLTSEDEELP